jgi:hypothetical protein
MWVLDLLRKLKGGVDEAGSGAESVFTELIFTTARGDPINEEYLVKKIRSDHRRSREHLDDSHPDGLRTKQRSYYNRTIHGSLRQAQKFLGKKINVLGANTERDGAKIRLAIPRSMAQDSEIADLQQDV